MRSHSILAVAAGWILLVGSTSGCAINDLKEANRRLKESNDRLISENNRLEHELAANQAGGVPIQVAKATPVVQDSIDNGPIDIDVFPAETQVTRSPIGVHYRFPSRVFFGLGQAQLTRQGQQVLKHMGDLLNGDYYGHMIRVEGHTDDVPVKKVRNRYPTNWELSTARACTVVRYLVDKGSIEPQRIYPTGFAFYRPVDSGRGARAKNRRVEITILNKQVASR